ncbi:MAG TPA: hypothetical protein VGR65_03925 [Casimicrobiaceae bacterium]|nr:hypothetical protein [Casimicrobiaceae bacterium]
MADAEVDGYPRVIAAALALREAKEMHRTHAEVTKGLSDRVRGVEDHIGVLRGECATIKETRSALAVEIVKGARDDAEDRQVYAQLQDCLRQCEVLESGAPVLVKELERAHVAGAHLVNASVDAEQALETARVEAKRVIVQRQYGRPV